MATNLEFILKLVDRFTPGMRQAVGLTNSSAAQIERQFERMGSGGRRMTASVDELRNRLNAINQVRFSTTVQREFDTATRAANRLERQIERLENRGRSGGGLMGMAGGMLGAVGVGALGTNALSMAAEREQQQVSFRVMTGSQKSGDKMLSDIVTMGARTPYESGDLIKAAQTMKQFGIENQKVLPNLSMLGDVAAGNKEKLLSLSLAFSQVQSTGRLQGQDLMQLINAGFNPLLIISEKTGIKMADLKKKMEDGAISADMVTKAFQIATGPGGQFHNMMELQSQTMSGRWSTFMDAGKEKLLSFGQALKPIAFAVMDFGTSLLAGEGPAIAIAVAVGALTAAIWGGSVATSVLSIKTAILNAVMAANPVMLVVSAIALLTAGVIYAWNKFGWFRGAVLGTWEALKSFGTLIKDFVIDRISGMVKGITGIGEMLYHFFTGSWKKAWDVGKQAAKDIVGVDAVKNAVENGKKVGVAFSGGYKDGQAQIAAKMASKAKAGVSPTSATADMPSFSASDMKSLSAAGKSKADSINSGGQRSIVIHIGKQIETLQIHVMSAKETAQEIESIVRESIRRVIYSLNSVAS